MTIKALFFVYQNGIPNGWFINVFSNHFDHQKWFCLDNLWDSELHFSIKRSGGGGGSGENVEIVFNMHENNIFSLPSGRSIQTRTAFSVTIQCIWIF